VASGNGNGGSARINPGTINDAGETPCCMLMPLQPAPRHNKTGATPLQHAFQNQVTAPNIGRDVFFATLYSDRRNGRETVREIGRRRTAVHAGLANRQTLGHVQPVACMQQLMST